ncbi:MAG TPA: UDP-N-acetylglucosamine 1-carboxyvinyltransferase [Alphaproteobacteria bacterium]|nr:UDP-N-acetylglucosamine 1-carboxyvinyltransferase [Alphaproteobacteria bacterium]
MDKIAIRGRIPLNGEIKISGAKNAALPLMATCLLTDKPLHLINVPKLSDIASMSELLSQLGVAIELGTSSDDQTMQLCAKDLSSTTAPYDVVRKMRASVLVLGPLVARSGEAHVSLPGGCAIGTRPIDLHLKGLEALGAQITLKEGYVHAYAPQGLTGATFTFPMVSVTGSENLLMAATLAKGQTRLINVAREPEVTDLAHCLNAMGAKISGMGTDTLIIEGVNQLNGTTHRVIADRIEVGTYAMAAALTGGKIRLKGASLELIPTAGSLLQQAGVSLKDEGGDLLVTAPINGLQGVDVMTEPFPGFATDLQAQWMALMSVAEGASMITETIFENRFMHVPELCRMGANITVHGSSALVRGVKGLKGAPVMATDLRASVSLVLAGLVAEGETIISRVYHLDRGYEQVEEKLRACGADIRRVR